MNDNERGLTFTERLALLSKLGKAGGGDTPASPFETVTFTGVWETDSLTWTCDKTFAELCDMLLYEGDIVIGFVYAFGEGESEPWTARRILSTHKYRSDGAGSDVESITFTLLDDTSTYWTIYQDDSIESNY